MTNHETAAEPELTETQKAYNLAQYEIFQLAAYGHCTYTNGELLTDEGKRQQADYNDRIRAAREELEAALLRLVAEHAETFRGDWGVPAAWLRSLADDPAGLSLLAVRPDERDDDGPAPAAVSVPPPAPRADDQAALFREAANALAAVGLEDSLVSGPRAWAEAIETLRRMADEAQQPEPHSCPNCEGIDPDTCLMNPNRPPEQCPRSEGDGYGLQCQKPAGHNLCTFEEEQPTSGPCVAGEQQNETPEAEVVHACPPDGSGLTPCCGRTPFELPRTDRISSEAPVTCPGKEA